MDDEETPRDDPKYSKLDDDESKSGIKSEEEEPTVTVNLNETSQINITPYKCTMQNFLGCCSLKAGCIVVAILYSIYAAFYIGAACSLAIILSMFNDVFVAWNIHICLNGAYISIFVVVLLSIGIHKGDYRRILTAKILMLIHLVLKIILSISCVLYELYIGIGFLILPELAILYSFFIAHSYESYLWVSQKRKLVSAIPLLGRFRSSFNIEE